MLRHITCTDLLKPESSPISHAVVDGQYAFLAGLVAADVPGGDESIGDVGAETDVVLTATKRILAELGLGMERVVRVDVHLADLRDIRAMNAVYGRFFKEGAYPARTCTESPKLVGGCRVEITCVARL